MPSSCSSDPEVQSRDWTSAPPGFARWRSSSNLWREHGTRLVLLTPPVPGHISRRVPPGRAWRQAHAKLRPRIQAKFDEQMNRHGLRHARYWGLANHRPGPAQRADGEREAGGQAPRPPGAAPEPGPGVGVGGRERPWPEWSARESTAAGSAQSLTPRECALAGALCQRPQNLSAASNFALKLRA
jgi:hypothetical protein